MPLTTQDVKCLYLYAMHSLNYNDDNKIIATTRSRVKHHLPANLYYESQQIGLIFVMSTIISKCCRMVSCVYVYN